VDAQVDDHALVAVLLEACGDADRSERLHKGEHLQTEDPAHGRLDERDFHRLVVMVTRETRCLFVRHRNRRKSILPPVSKTTPSPISSWTCSSSESESALRLTSPNELTTRCHGTSEPLGSACSA